MPRKYRPLRTRRIPRFRRRGLDRAGRLKSGFRAFAALWVLAIPIAIAGANAVQISRAGQSGSAIGVGDLPPAECSASSPSVLYTGPGPVAGGATDDLVLGGPAAQALDGGSGDDCILGGGGDDEVKGGPGMDVCIGGPGTDTFDADCETTVQGDATF